jgi:Asp-tRNA(Asn)/Glu-tRNA(Gln) amidotransferase A subunit family amidase
VADLALALDVLAGGDRFRAWFGDHDVLLSPTLAQPPLRVGAYRGKGWPGPCSG